MEASAQREYSSFIQPYILEIDAYVSKNICKKHQNFYKDHVPTIAERIEKIVLDIFEEAKETALKRKADMINNYDVTIIKYKFDHPLMALIVAILEKEFQFKCKARTDALDKACPSIGVDIVYSNSFNYKLTCIWSPKNPFIFGQKVARRKMPAVSTNETSKKLYAKTQMKEFKGIKLIAEGKEFKVHKAILRSDDIFDRMFSTGMHEKESKTIEFPDTKAEVLENFIRYLYEQPFTFDVKKDIYTLADLFQLAHMYELKNLVDICAYHIENWVESNEITMENCSEIFLPGSLYGNEFLVNKCLDWAEKQETGPAIILSLVNNKNIAFVHRLAQKRGNKKFEMQLLEKMYEYLEKSA